MIAEVIVDIAHGEVDRVFDYKIEDGTYPLGSRVEVPFGRQTIEGFIIGLKENSSLPQEKIKSVIRALDEFPALSNECLTLAKFLKDNNVDVLICGGIGENAIKNLTSHNIKVVNGVTGDSDISVAKFLAKTLNFSLEANCKHEQDKVERHQCHSHHDDCNECN